jgi:translation initiation factor 3 subunit C
MLKSHISSSIGKHQPANQICYNRTIVQIGFAAFRLGFFDEANSILLEFAQSLRLKESLAQGSSYNRNIEKTIEDEIEEKKRFVPPHLQINLELLDCIYMTTSMFLELVNIHQNRFNI